MAIVASNMSGHIQKQLTRSLERILEEAHLSGELKLSGRKLKDFPKINKTTGVIKYNLQDTVFADLSKNRFVELPEEVTELYYLEKLYLYHNAIKIVPETVVTLQSLSFLDLSRNQLSNLPREICQLPLQTLLVAHNRLVLLPEELGKMSALSELDVGCNEITTLPSRMGDLLRLRYLDLRNNLLVHIPIELTYLKLIKFNISGNRISVLPNEMRKMKSLVDLKLLDNPMTSPPAALCIRGRIHIFKYLERQAAKHERARCSRARRGLIDLRGHATLDTRSHRRNIIDRGYATSECVDKRWSQEMKSATHNVNAYGAWRKECSPLYISLSHDFCLNSSFSGNSTPSTISPGENTSLEDELGKALILQNQLEKKKLGQGISKTAEDTQKFAATNHRVILSTPGYLEGPLLRTSHEDNSTQPLHLIQTTNLIPLISGEDKKSLNHIQTYREYKEALKQQRVNEGQNIYRLKDQMSASGNSSLNNSLNSTARTTSTEHQIFHGEYTNKNSTKKGTTSNVNHAILIPCNENEVDINTVIDSKYDQVYRKPSSPTKISNYSLSGNNGSDDLQRLVKSTVDYVEGQKSLNKRSNNPSSCQSTTWGTDLPENYSFTMRRELERAKEEADLITQLRTNIETRLKMALPDDLPLALMDGVVLCHLANHVRPRAVASIHVPSPAVPKLTMARCRRNVDNFLEACRKIGVDEEVLLDADAIMDVGYMDAYGLEALGRLVSALMLDAEESIGSQELCASSARTIQDHILSTILLVTFLSILILLHSYPIPD